MISDFATSFDSSKASKIEAKQLAKAGWHTLSGPINIPVEQLLDRGQMYCMEDKTNDDGTIEAKYVRINGVSESNDLADAILISVCRAASNYPHVVSSQTQEGKTNNKAKFKRQAPIQYYTFYRNRNGKYEVQSQLFYENGVK